MTRNTTKALRFDSSPRTRLRLTYLSDEVVKRYNTEGGDGGEPRNGRRTDWRRVLDHALWDEVVSHSKRESSHT